MKSALLIIGILILGIIGCKSDESVKMDYCKMLSKDQSHLDNEKKRNQLFIENYEQIIQLTNQQGFPNINFEKLPQDSCKYWAVTATLIHMAQSKPETFFSEASISLFKEEMSKGNIESEDLIPVFKISFMTNEFCEDLKKNIKMAIQEWGMDSVFKSKPKFKKCN